MKTKDYYINELNSLRVDGAQFAKENPGLSSYLAKEGQDPDVERMLEGFAFLTGKLRQKLDEELPEVAHNLVQLLWPNYIRPIPSYSIIKFDAIEHDTNNQTIPKAMQVLSKSTAKGVVTKFQTCFETKVMPLQLEKVHYAPHAQESILELDFSMSAAGTLADIDFEPLRVFLSGSKFMAKELYLYFSRYIRKIELIVKDEESKELGKCTLPNDSVSALGFNPLETILPYSRNVFDGYVLLQEYFCYPDKHLFFDIHNLNEIEYLSQSITELSKKFSLKFYFKKHLSSAQLPVKNDFSLFCTPVVNLFQSDAVPIRKTEKEDEYLLSSSEYKRDQSEIFSIENVRGWIPSRKEYKNYHHFHSFEHMKENEEYYSERVRLNNNMNSLETYIRFASAGGRYLELEHGIATVSVKMVCTNKNVPSKLHLGDISVCDPHSPSELRFENITIPSVSYPPPIKGDFLWKLISNMSLNYLSLDNIETLKMILQTYDFYGANDIKEKAKTDVMISGLSSISNKKIQMIYEGLPIRGIETELRIDITKFTGLGEAYHFCSILNEFFSLYCSVNSFHRLIVHVDKNNSFSWPAKMGYDVLV